MKSNLLSKHIPVWRIASAFAGGLLAWGSAWAQLSLPPGYPNGVEGYDRREVAMLPRYCLFTLAFRQARVPGGEDQAVTDRWYAYLGPTFVHMHHYCWGLMKTNRATLLARDATTRNFYLQDAIKEFDYVIEHAPDDFLPLPEILTKRAENWRRLGKSSVGVLDLERAISLKPDYWPPYAELSDHFKSTGEIDKARSTLEMGLAKSPDATALKRRLTELSAAKKTR
jgi:hypothetical protein